MRAYLALLSALLAGTVPTAALDVSGVVVNKLDQPVPAARICLEAHPARCVDASQNGAFRITDAGLAVAEPGRGRPYSLELLGARMALTVPEPVTARILWLDAAGRALAPERRADLRPGRNLLDLPALPRDGLHFVRLSLPGRTLAWKALLLGGTPASAPEAAAGRAAAGGALAALSKTAAIRSDLIVTQAGFRPATYRPLGDVETEAYVVLRALSDSGFTFTSTLTSRSTLDRAGGRWFTEDTVAECQGSAAVKTVYRDTSRYALRDGALYQFYPGECRGERLTGGGDDVVGTWTFSGFNVFLPADLRPADCRDTVPADAVPPGMRGVVAITESQQTFTYSAEICPADLYLDLFLLFLVTDPAVELTRNTCRNAAFRNGGGEEAVLAFAGQGDSLIAQFAAGDRTCRAAEMMRDGPDVPLDCLAPDPVDALLDCVGATAFFGAQGVSPSAKRSAARIGGAAPPMSRLPRVRGGARTAARWPEAAASRAGKVYISHP